MKLLNSNKIASGSYLIYVFTIITQIVNFRKISFVFSLLCLVLTFCSYLLLTTYIL